MSQRDFIDDVLAGQSVPMMSAGLADRIVAEAQRPGRTPHFVAPRRRARRWTRRGVWTAAIALNLVLASAVAAAIGGAGFMPASIVAATHRVIAQIRPHLPSLRHHLASQVVAEHRRAVPPRFLRALPISPRFAPVPHVPYRAGFAQRPLFRSPHPGLRGPAYRVVRPFHQRVGLRQTRAGRYLQLPLPTKWRARHDAFQQRGFGVERYSRQMGLPPGRWRMPAWRNGPGRVWNRGGWRLGPRFGGGRRGRRW